MPSLFPLLLIPLGILLLYSVRRWKNDARDTASKLRWLGVFFVGSYFICSALVNKDIRYIMPYLPVVAIVLAYGLTLLPTRLAAIRWGTVLLAFLLMCFNLFPIAGTPGKFLVQHFSPQAENYPYRGEQLPHREVIGEITNTTPQLQATLGVLPRTVAINHN